MSYIAPQTDIYLCTNIPLDPNYEETILFENPTQQHDYFRSRAPWIFSEQYYQRRERGWLRISAPADNVFNANYLMFKNTRNGLGKWFYAFITSCEYINENTCEIKYELDVMQSFMFNYTLEECFVEREHSATDRIGDNLVPENLAIGDIIIRSTSKIDELDTLCIVFASSRSTDGGIEHLSVGHSYGGVFSGLALVAQLNTIAGVRNLIDWLNYINWQDWITGNKLVSAYYAPAYFHPIEDEIPESGTGELPFDTRALYLTMDMPTSFGEGNNVITYTPKNKKLLTYPYNYIEVDNNQGQRAEYKYEMFETPNARFKVTGNSMPNPSLLCIPEYYKNQDLNFNESFELRGFPQCTWISDQFAAWLAQTAVQGIVMIASSGASSAAAASEAGANSLGVTDAAVEGVGKGVDKVGASMAAGLLSGKANSASIQGNSPSYNKLCNGLYNYKFYAKQITMDFAKRIDSFFSRYGYATRKIKIPNTNVRRKWCYTKTIGCKIKSTFPNDYTKKIESIYDGGITFWKYSDTIDDDIGNYELDNNPIATN